MQLISFKLYTSDIYKIAGISISLCVCLPVCELDISKTQNHITVKSIIGLVHDRRECNAEFKDV